MLPSLESVSSNNSNESLGHSQSETGLDRIEKLEAIINQLGGGGVGGSDGDIRSGVSGKSSVCTQTLSTGDIVMTSIFSEDH